MSDYLLYITKNGDSRTVSLQRQKQRPCFEKTFHPKKGEAFSPTEQAEALYRDIEENPDKYI